MKSEMLSQKQTTFGKLKQGQQFFFDRTRMSEARSANRPHDICVKESPYMFRRLKEKELYLCDSRDPVNPL